MYSSDSVILIFILFHKLYIFFLTLWIAFLCEAWVSCCVTRTEMSIVSEIFKLEYLILHLCISYKKKDKGRISRFLTCKFFLSLVCWIDNNLSADCDFKWIVP